MPFKFHCNVLSTHMSDIYTRSLPIELLTHIHQIQIQSQIRIFQQVHVPVVVSANFKHLFDLSDQYNSVVFSKSK